MALTVLAISAHPDDETLGCGGTLLRHRMQGDSLHWAIATKATTPQWSDEVIAVKSAEVEVVAQGYGMTSVHRLGLPTMRLETLPINELIERLRNIILQVRPNVIYLPHAGDVSTDHGVVFTATLSVVKAFYMQKLGISRVLSFETLSSTEAAAPRPYNAFIPNVYVDISPFCEQKVTQMALYKTEAHSDPMPRGPSAIRALARYRGATISVEYAEAFMLIREVI